MEQAPNTGDRPPQAADKPSPSLGDPPVIGPTLGGWITDTYTWHWVFLINVPMGLLSLFLVGTLVKEPSGAKAERQKFLAKGLRFDYLGFVFVAIGLDLGAPTKGH